MQLSEDGGRCLPHAQALLEAQRQGREARVYDRCELSGPLGLLVPSDFERNLMLAWMDEFQHQHPSLSLQMRMSDRAAYLLRQPLDAAVHHGSLADSSLVALQLIENNRRALCASPGHLEPHDIPKTIDDGFNPRLARRAPR